MESVRAWLSQTLFPDSVLQVWMAAAGLAVVLLLILVLLLVCRRRKKRRRILVTEEPVTQQPEARPVLEVANLQGIGNREEQQDAFGISRVDRYAEQGLLAVLCDGMGGMAEGGRIAAGTVASLLEAFPWEEDDGVPDWIRRHSGQVYQQFRGRGGTTLVAVVLRGNALSFWCVGDSDLFLLREGKLYGMNLRQEYRNELTLRALEGAFPLEEAFTDPQAGALSEYIGKEDPHSDHTRIPFLLQPEDAILLCSDGVSDTLTLRQLRECLALPPQTCCEKLEEEILAAGKPGQDNYTAIVLRYYGEEKEEQ